MAHEHRPSAAGLVLALAIVLAGPWARPVSALAQANPLMGVWDGVTVLDGAQVPLRYVITAGHAVTRQALLPSGLMTFVGEYEIVGNQLHIVWHDWAPRQRQFWTGPLSDDCMVRLEGPNAFECGGVRFRRVQ